MTAMLREITEQPEALQRTLLDLKAAAADITHRRPNRLLFLARGTSDNAAVYGRYLAEIVAGVPASLGTPSHATLYRTRPDLRGVLAVLVSQSGETEELLAAATWARDNGARTVAITNTPDSPLAHSCDGVLGTSAGPEQAVPATKTHTCQLLAVAMLVLSMADGKYSRCLADVPADAQRLVSNAAEATAAALPLGKPHALIVAGRGFTLATAQELALKIEETSGIVCLGLSAADLQHGPAAAFGPTNPVIVVQAPGPTTPSLLHTAQLARAAGSPVLAIGDDLQLRAIAHHHLAPSRLPEHLYPITGIIPGQFVAERLARRFGRNPDQPIGLRKVSQTV